ncbi:MAG: polysaccharide biosynthesis C-terminal domain-containing protein [Flavobacteriales bacterium]|nr:polysaccharide biosynthesis C-terminal domain-containing protein [Flavobacteriales bacterium]
MATIKKLLSQTAIYGLSSVLGRVLNFLLVPLYTMVFDKEEYGQVAILYAYVAIFNVLLSYGMETSFFNFINKKANTKVFSTAFISLIGTSLGFFAFAITFNKDISILLGFQDHPEYISYLIWVLVFDAITVIPFAQLRYQNKAFTYAIIKLTNIGITIALNLLLLLVIPGLIREGYSFGDYNAYLSNPGIGVIFLANLIASGVTILMIVPTFINIKWEFDKALWKKMISYGWPILIGGTAGIINEAMDRPLLLWLLPSETAVGEIGIYAANYKISIFMTLFIQAFRMGVEPFFFAKAKDKDAKETYAFVMNYFVAIMAVIFLFIMVNLDVFKHFIRNEEMWVGLDVVPILLFANLSLGIYISLSVWYKINEKTKYGAIFSIIGAIITLALNIWLIPTMGFYGSAWATLAAYGSMALLSYIVGQRIYPIPYDLKRISLYLGLSVFLGLIAYKLFYGNLIVGNSLLLLFIIMLAFFESASLRSIFVKNK